MKRKFFCFVQPFCRLGGDAEAGFKNPQADFFQRKFERRPENTASRAAIKKIFMPNKKIVILGAGFAGLRCAKILCRYYPGQVVLIDKNKYHLYLPLLYKLDKEKVELPIRTRAQFIQQEIKDYHRLTYDYLVLATGAEIDYYDIEGLQENALVLQNLENLEQLRNILSGNVLVVGGGVTGVELSAELALRLKNGRVKIIEACPQILSNLDDDLRTKAERRLQKLGVEIFTNRCLEKVEPNKVIFKNGQSLAFDHLVWAGGVKLGKYQVDQYLRVKGEKNVFAVGDCANANPGLIHPALKQAEIAALNIKKSITGRPLVSYQPKHLGMIIPLGGYYAIGKIGKIRITGFPAWLVKKLIHFIYKRTYA